MKSHRFIARCFAAFAIASLVSTAFVASAQAAAAPAVILVVNTQQLFGQSKVGTSLRNQLMAFEKKLQADSKKAETDLQAEAKKLGSQRGLISQEDFQKKVQALQKKEAAMQASLRKRGQEMQAGADKARRQIEEAVQPIFVDVMKKNGATLIIDQSVVLAGITNLDVTQDVLTLLDAKLTTVKVVPVATAK